MKLNLKLWLRGTDWCSWCGHTERGRGSRDLSTLPGLLSATGASIYAGERECWVDPDGETWFVNVLPDGTAITWEVGW